MKILLSLLLIHVYGHRTWISENILNTARLAADLTFSSALSATSVRIELENEGNSQYTGSIKVGTPGQKIDGVLFDTGSNDLWLFGENTKKYITGVPTFDQQSSSTFNQTFSLFSLKYVTGYACGNVVEDVLNIGEKVIPVHRFGLVTIFSDCLQLERKFCVSKDRCVWQEENNTCSDFVYPLKRTLSGILGLGYTKERSNSNSPLVFEGSPLERFSFYLTDPGASGSLFIIGDSDHTLYNGPMLRCSLQDGKERENPDWTIGISDIRVGKNKLGIQFPMYASIDTGSSVIAVDSLLWYQHLESTIFKDAVCGSTYPFLHCKGKLPEVAFVVQNTAGEEKELALSAKDYNLQNIQFFPVEGLYKQGVHLILGHTFLRKFYTEFNYRDREIGFAILETGKGDLFFWL